MSALHFELPRALVFDSHGQPKDVHVHYADTTLGGDPCLFIDGELFVVRSVPNA